MSYFLRNKNLKIISKLDTLEQKICQVNWVKGDRCKIRCMATVRKLNSEC